MPRFPGIGRRVAEQLRVQGFWKDDRPDVGRFCRERGYRPQYVYAWLQDRTPDYDNLTRLARDFEVPIAWLVSGDGPTASDHASARRSRQATSRSIDGTTPRTPETGILDVGVLRDAADKVVALKADLDAALGAFPVPCFWLDETGLVLGVHGIRDAGLPAGLIGRTLRDAMPPEAASALHRALSRALSVDEPVTVDYEVTTDRGVRIYEARVGTVKALRRPRRAFVVVHDVTERRVREAEYRRLVDGSPNGLCIHRDYVIVFANTSMARIFGYARASELVGADIRSLVPGHRAPDGSRSHDERRRPISSRQQCDGVTKDGGRIPVIALVSSVMWASEPATLLTILTPAVES